MWLRARVVAVVAAACCLTGGTVVGAPVLPAAAATAAGAAYVPLGPVRVLDTRNAIGHSGAVGPNETISLQVTGANGVSVSGVTAVVMNVTAVSPTAASYVTVYPDGQARPNASNLNFTAGESIANLVTAPVGSNGQVDFYNHAGTVNLIADLAGYYTTSGTGSLFVPAGPSRVLDTRNAIGHSGAIGPNGTLSLQISGNNGLPPTGLTAVVLNVTAVSPTDASYVTVFPDGTARPNASSLNFTRGESIPNLVIVPVGADGKVDFYNHAGSVSLIADLAGYYYAGGSQYSPLGPVRVLDTRNAIGHSGAVGPNGTISLQVAGANSVPATGVTAVVLNVTAVNPTASSYVTVYPDGTARPNASSLNFTRGESIPNLVVAPVGADGKIDFYNHAGSVSLIADLAGYYTAGGAPWGNAIEVPGTAALDTGGVAEVTSVSCPSAGNCAAGGDYNVSGASNPGPNAVFVADEVNGTWDNAIQVPGLAALSSRDYAYIDSVSCGSVGNCAAVGLYDGNSGYQAFVADEVNGTWDNAIQLPGIAGLNTAQAGDALAVSCPSAGDCAVGGYYASSSGYQAFVADEVNGTWGAAIQVPGIAALNAGGGAFATTVSCSSAGDCALGGRYTDSSGHSQAFVADEVNGTWGNAIEVPGTAALNTGGSAGASSVSCPSSSTCTIGGDYTDSSGHSQAFAADEVNGTWGDAIEVPGTGALNTGGSASVSSVSCPSAGNCAAAGRYLESSPGAPSYEAFVVSEVNGSWGEAIQVPGTATLSTSGPSWALSVSCASAGSCVAGGQAVTPSTGPGGDAFVVSEVNGTWGEAILVAGLNTQNAVAFSVSCPQAGSCAAAGTYYPVGSGNPRAFVVSQN